VQQNHSNSTAKFSRVRGVDCCCISDQWFTIPFVCVFFCSAWVCVRLCVQHIYQVGFYFIFFTGNSFSSSCGRACVAHQKRKEKKNKLRFFFFFLNKEGKHYWAIVVERVIHQWISDEEETCQWAKLKKKKKTPWAWNNKHSNNHQPTNNNIHQKKNIFKKEKKRKEKRNGVDVKLLVDYLLAVDSHHSGECGCVYLRVSVMTPWISAINSLQPVCCCRCCLCQFLRRRRRIPLIVFSYISLSLPYAFSFGIDSAELLSSWLLRNIRFIVGQSEFCRGATWMASQVAGDHEPLLPIE
jgi:hypothetical protein